MGYREFIDWGVGVGGFVLFIYKICVNEIGYGVGGSRYELFNLLKKKS